jgi:hypothetical protein
MNEEFVKLNQKYNDDTYPVFPFISPNRITPLKAGFYRKHKAKFRGVTAIFNKDTGEYEYPLYGMYYIPEDLVVVPTDLEMNPNKEAFLEALLRAGYRQISEPPKFVTFKFPPDSLEAKLALANKVEYQYLNEAPKYNVANEDA